MSVLSIIRDKVGDVRLASRILGVWLLIVAWWGTLLIVPLYTYSMVVRSHLTYILLFSIILLFLGSFRRNIVRKTSYLWIFPITTLITCFILGTLFYGFSLLTLLILAVALLLITDFSKLGFLTRFMLIITLIFFGLEICTLITGFTRTCPGLISGFVAPQISFVLNLFGQSTAIINGFIIYQSERIFFDLIKSGFYLTLGFYVGFIVLALESKISNKRRVALVALGGGIHYIFMLCYSIFVALTIPPSAYAEINQFHEIYWTKIITFFFILTLIWFLIFKKFASKEGITWHLPEPNISRTCIFLGFFLFLLIFSIFATYNFYGFRDSTNTVIVFDEIHSEWESTILDYNTTDFGMISENNFHLFADFLSRFYQIYIITDKNVTLPLDYGHLIHAKKIDEQLLKFDKSKIILVLKCPTKPLPEEEIETIVEFVKDGGSLLLIGDHTDVYLMNTYLNNISKHFGITFHSDSVYMIEGGWIVTDKNDYIHHPTTHYLNEFLWATGCSLSVQPPARAIAFSPFPSFNDHGDYHKEFFLGDGEINPCEICGSSPIMAVSEYGKGKVFAFTDSTCFNNYLFFTPGKRELIAGIIQWLSYSNAFDPFKILFFFSSLGLIFIAIYFKTKSLSTLLFLLIITAPLSSLSGYAVAFYLNDQTYEFPDPVHQLPPQILFDDSHKSSHCIAFGNSTFVLREDSYSNFYSSVGRLDMYPTLNYKQSLTPDLLRDYSILIIISPKKDFSKEEITAIQNYVKNGGGLLLIEGATHVSTINKVANIFNITFDLRPAKINISSYPSHTNPTKIYGGKPMQNVTFASYLNYGDGLVIALGDDLLFTDQNFIEQPQYLVALEWQFLTALSNRLTIMLKR